MKSLIAKKVWISLTGLFLCLFLVVHLSANLILVFPESLSKPAYNAYSTFLRENPFITAVAYLLYASIILHVVHSLIVTLRNRRARKQSYQYNNSAANSTWQSQNMGWMGILILIFITIHLVNFWSRIKLGLGNPVEVDQQGYLDVYSVTYALFQNPFYVAFYVVLMIPLGYHLQHGFKSAFMSLGFHSNKGLALLAKISLVYALAMAIGFALIPIIVYLR